MLNQYIGYEMKNMVEAAAFRDLLDKDRDVLDDFCSQGEQDIMAFFAATEARGLKSSTQITSIR